MGRFAAQDLTMRRRDPGEYIFEASSSATMPTNCRSSNNGPLRRGIISTFRAKENKEDAVRGFKRGVL